METWINRMVRTRSLRQVVAWAVVLVVFVLFALSQLRYIQNFLFGPYDLGAAELAAIGNVSETPRYFVRVTGSKAVDTGIQQITIHKRNGVETSRSVTGAYYALVVGDKFLICKGASGPQTTFEGEIRPLPADLTTSLFSSPDVPPRDRFFSYYVNTESFRTGGYIAIAVFVGLVILLVMKALPAWKRYKDPAQHPLVKRVQGWGDPLGVSVAAEREAGLPKFKSKNGWLVTDQFLVKKTFFSFDLLRVSDLLWAYKKITKHSVNFIPTGKTYAALLACYGGTAEIQNKEAKTDEILAFAAGRAPWAIFGYSDELAKAFKKDTKGFCAAVEQRKRDLPRKDQAPATK